MEGPAFREHAAVEERRPCDAVRAPGRRTRGVASADTVPQLGLAYGRLVSFPTNH